MNTTVLSIAAAGLFFAIAAAGLFFALTGRADAANCHNIKPCLKTNGSCKGRISVTGGAKVPYYRNYRLMDRNCRVKRAVIVIHGMGRNADGYFKSVLGAAKTANRAKDVLVIAPHFQSTQGDTPDSPLSDELRWSEGGWKSGNRSKTQAGIPRLSSFHVVDQLIKKLVDRSQFPNLRKIVVTGHSAGGQFVQRFAAGTGVDIGQPNHSFVYVVANPSSYMYLNPFRVKNGALNKFRFPITGCNYNKYKYGLNDRNAYMARTSKSQIRSRFRSRRVVYLAGRQDTGRESGLDKGCAAEFQGQNRFLREQIYMNYMDHYFKPHNHRFVPVPAVGHSAQEIFQSANGRRVLFLD